MRERERERERERDDCFYDIPNFGYLKLKSVLSSVALNYIRKSNFLFNNNLNQKKTREHVGKGVTNCNWYTWNDP